MSLNEFDLAALEQSVHENLPPPGYAVWPARPTPNGSERWGWEAGPHREDARVVDYVSRRKACLAAWDHFKSTR